TMPEEERRKRIDELLHLVQLEAKRDERIKNLSGGMKRRLEIARGLMTRPKVLFLDEPTIGLDPQTRMRMWEYIKGVNNEGTIIFLTTHYMDEADQLSNRIAIIDYGRIVAEGRPYELKNALGQDLIYLETADNARARAVLEGTPNVGAIHEKGGGLLVMVTDDGTRVLPHMLDALRTENVAVTGINMKKPSMDDVFIHYTGRELRDERAENAATAVNRAGRH
ncbi:MAG TPA: ATP-binding cassette domain-containing protein, partial [Methanoregulaceae archaeon]|nr:ATP-binding cassette domain-containing protein [Methanoregulaceae archaeon]